jgi:hypothetical protein
MAPSDHEPNVKRRKVRKGTRSCWECKGRKVKCNYMTSEDSVCDGCTRRGSSCVSQELPKQPLAPIDRRRQIGNRMFRMESLIEKLVKKAENVPQSPGTFTSESSEGTSSRADLSAVREEQSPDTDLSLSPELVSSSNLAVM